LYGLALPLAVIACCLAGALGGFILARPEEALDKVGLALPEATGDGMSITRAVGGMLLLAHAGTAGLLGYNPGLGAGMALALALVWGGAVLGRVFNSLKVGPGDGRSLQALAFEVMMAITLALPFWSSRNGFEGPTYLV
jgi:hypothetical protein